MQQTPIGWTDFSVNLIKYRDSAGKVVWACVHASEGCRFCYSQTLALRWGRGKEFTAENMKTLTPFFDEAEASQILTSKKIKGKRVFVNDMTDWMGPWIDSDIIDQCLATFAARSDVIFQTLTKHADRQCEYFNDNSLEDRITELWQGDDEDRKTWNILLPLENLHIGISAEDQKNADDRLPRLVATPAAVRWASLEPLLGPIGLHSIRCKGAGFFSALDGRGHDGSQPDGTFYETLNGIVIGGESGPGHRDMPLDGAIALARQAAKSGCAVFFKQDSGARPGKQGRVPDDIWALKEWPA